MTNINKTIFYISLTLFLYSCNSLSDVQKTLRNEKVDSSDEFFILLGLLSLVVLVVNQIIRLGSTWYMSVITHQIWLEIHERLFSFYLYQPYLYHVNNSSNKLLEKLQVRVNATVAGVITPIFKIIGSVISNLKL
mgnify:CR=1 FL=1